MSDYCVRCHETINAGIPTVLKNHPWEYDLESGICEGCGQLTDDLVVGLRPSLYKRIIQRKKYLKSKSVK